MKSPLYSTSKKGRCRVSSRPQLASILHKSFFTFGRKSLFLEEAVRLRTLAVAEQHDLRTIRLETEILEIRSQHGAVPLASHAFTDNEMLDQGIRLVAMHWIRAQGYKRGPANPVVCLKNKEEVLRIGAYLLNPISSQIHFDFWSDGMNKLMIEERDCGDVTGLGLPDLNHIWNTEYGIWNTECVCDCD
jgi:hypothetical protein